MRMTDKERLFRTAMFRRKSRPMKTKLVGLQHELSILSIVLQYSIRPLLLWYPLNFFRYRCGDLGFLFLCKREYRRCSMPFLSSLSLRIPMQTAIFNSFSKMKILQTKQSFPSNSNYDRCNSLRCRLLINIVLFLLSLSLLLDTKRRCIPWRKEQTVTLAEDRKKFFFSLSLCCHEDQSPKCNRCIFDWFILISLFDSVAHRGNEINKYSSHSRFIS